MKPCSRPFPNYKPIPLVLFAFLLCSAKLIDRTVVTVNSEPILESDVDKFSEKLRSKSFQELFGGIDPRSLNSRDAILQLLVEEKLINQQVKKLELQATDQEVAGQIRSIVQRNQISEAQLSERLRQLGTSMAEYREGIRRQIERRNLIDREIRPSLEVTEEQLRHFYARNSKADENETEYVLAHILISPKAKGPAAWDDAQKRAQKVLTEVRAKPEDFASFAKQYSDDPTSNDSGGSLGAFTTGALAKEFKQAVQRTGPGQVTAPIKMADGFHILKVIETKTADFAQIPKDKKEAVRQQMIAIEVEKKMALWLERKKREANIHRIGGTENAN